MIELCSPFNQDEKLSASGQDLGGSILFGEYLSLKYHCLVCMFNIHLDIIVDAVRVTLRPISFVLPFIFRPLAILIAKVSALASQVLLRTSCRVSLASVTMSPAVKDMI